MRIVLITVCKNEKRLLPFFFRHYEGIVDEYVFFDNGSTDGTTELIRQQANTRLIEFNTLGYYKEETLTFIRNSAYRQLRLDADWFFIVDVDEFLWNPDLRAYLEQCLKDKITMPKIEGYHAYTEQMPEDDGSTLLTDVIKSGWKDQAYNKFSIITPDVVPHYNYGSHIASPTGNVAYSNTPEIRLLHYSMPNINAAHTEFKTARRASQRCGNAISKEGSEDSRAIRKYSIDERLKYKMPILPDGDKAFLDNTRKRIENNEADAFHQMGLMYRLGQVVEQNPEMAFTWFDKAVALDHALATYQAGHMLKMGQNDLNTVVVYFRKAAKQGDIESQYQVGLILKDKNSLEHYSGEVEYWLKTAADRGHVDAQYTCCLYYDNATPPQHEEANKWERRAAETGHDLAQYNLAARLFNNQEYEEALEWAIKSAEGGLPRAYKLLDKMLDEGLGIPSNYEGSEKWFKMRLLRSIADI